MLIKKTTKLLGLLSNEAKQINYSHRVGAGTETRTNQTVKEEVTM